jgi:hypothetical protein
LGHSLGEHCQLNLMRNTAQMQRQSIEQLAFCRVGGSVPDGGALRCLGAELLQMREIIPSPLSLRVQPIAIGFDLFDAGLNHGVHFEDFLVVREQLRVHLNQVRHQAAGLGEQINGPVKLGNRKRRIWNAALGFILHCRFRIFRCRAGPAVDVCEPLAKPPPFVNDTGHGPISCVSAWNAAYAATFLDVDQIKSEFCHFFPRRNTGKEE